MKLVGIASNGNYIIEASQTDWADYIFMRGGYLPAVDEQLRSYRKEKGITQQKLADELQISRGYLSVLECGKASEISLSLFRRIQVVCWSGE